MKILLTILFVILNLHSAKLPISIISAENNVDRNYNKAHNLFYVKHDPAGALPYALLSSKSNINAYFLLGKMYYINYAGDDFMDIKKSIYYFRKCENEINDCSFYLGEIYFTGKYKTLKDYEMSLKYYKKSTYIKDPFNHGTKSAESRIGYQYKNALGTKENPRESFKWYMKNKTSSEAQYMIGEDYFTGYGTIMNKKVGLKWFLDSAKQGNVKAMDYLIFIYSHSYGYDEKEQLDLYGDIKKDLVKAKYWFEKLSKIKIREFKSNYYTNWEDYHANN